MPAGPSAVAQSSEPRADSGLRWLGDDQLLGLFVARGSESAFEAIVARHGPRVLGVCRQILGRPQDAEDAFQATFLLLARKAATIRKGDSVGHWLHGVAHRLSVRSRANATRRAAVEGAAGCESARSRSTEDAADRSEIRRVVHEEIDRLPDRLRQPILLCYLEGLSNDAAARRLGCPSSTLKERLAKARETLQGRLARRGVTLTVALLLLLLPRETPAEEIPPQLLLWTVDAAMAATARRSRPIGPPRAFGWRLPFLPMLALASIVAGSAVLGACYLASPGRPGFLPWFLGAIRRVCH